MAKKVPNFVEERLIDLKTFKDKYDLSTKAEIWKNKANMIDDTPREDENDFRTQISATVKRQKDAELSANMPEYSFIPMSDEAQSNRKIVRETWLYHWLKSNTDKALGKVIKSATTYGTGILYEGIRHTIKIINEPYTTKENGKPVLAFRKKEIRSSEICTEKIPFSNFFINGTDIDNSTEAVVVRLYNEDEYINEKKLNKLYKNINKIKGTSRTYPVGDLEGDDIGSGASDENLVTEISYYNSAKDEYKVSANGIEVLDSHIPYSHKELPFCLYLDNEAEDRIRGIGEFELLEKDELAKNEYRSLTIKGVKASIGLVIKERDSDIDIENADYGVVEVLEVDSIDGVRHFAPNIPIGAISELEAKVDNDIVAKSGVDFRSLQLTPGESATKTVSKSNSTKKRINLNIRDNGFDFFRRLGKLRLKNIQQLHENNAIRVPIEGGSITNKGIFITDETGSYGSGIIGANFIKGDFLVFPIIETMLGDSKQRRKTNLSTFMQVTGNLMGDDGKPIAQGGQYFKLACDEYGYDYDKLTEKENESQSADAIVDRVFSEGDTQIPGMEDPNAIPPEQRSGAKQQVNAISGQAKMDYEDELT